MSSRPAVRAVDMQALAVAKRFAVGTADAGDYRIQAPAEIARLLRTLHDDGVALELACDGGGDGGVAIGSRLCTVDAPRRLLGFAVAADDRRLPPLLTAERVTAAGLLDGVQLQFEADGLLLVHAADGRCTLRCAWPTRLWRLQRRGGYRVRPASLPTSGPRAVLRHLALADRRLSLRVLDLSIGGCALLLPDEVPGIGPGLRIDGVRLQLDAGTRIDVGLLLRHVGSSAPHGRGVRLGCEWARLSGDAERTLQRFIDQVQRKRPVLAPAPTPACS